MLIESKRFSKLKCQVTLFKHCQVLDLIQFLLSHSDTGWLFFFWVISDANSECENKVNKTFHWIFLEQWWFDHFSFFSSVIQNLVFFSNHQVNFSAEAKAGLWEPSSWTDLGLRNVERHVLGMPVHGVLAVEGRKFSGAAVTDRCGF